MKIPFSISLKITLLCFCLALLGIGGASYITYTNSKSLLHQQSHNNLAEKLDHRAIQLDSFFQSVNSDLDFLVTSGPLTRILNTRKDPLKKGPAESKKFWQQRLAGLFEVIMRTRPAYQRITFRVQTTDHKYTAGIERQDSSYNKLTPPGNISHYHPGSRLS